MSQILFDNLSVGYEGVPVLTGVNGELFQGKMTCILGSNGSGKTTLLKTLARIIPKVEGVIEISGKSLTSYKSSDLAKKMSVVLTDRISFENTSCFDVVSLGRYPHTGFFGILSQEDKKIAMECLDKCAASYLADKPFNCLSDGEKQKVLIARGLAQDPEVIILDEPTSHLDIKYKLEILSTLRRYSSKENKTVICTLHEPDLAVKCCDYLLLVRGNEILSWGTTKEVIESGALDQLYGLHPNQFDSLVGTVEFTIPDRKDIFFIGCDADSIPFYRRLSGEGFGFGTGILPENDVSCHIAKAMGAEVIMTHAYCPITAEDIGKAVQAAGNYRLVLMADFPDCEQTKGNLLLRDRLAALGKTVLNGWTPDAILKMLTECRTA